jgi:HEPN domain-containing protein
VGKAEVDYVVAEDIFRRRKQPVPDAVCFHAQQCAEKYLKAFLVCGKVDFPKTHDLIDLLRLALPSNRGLDVLEEDLLSLTPFAVNFCYPDAQATAEDARVAMRAVRRVRKVMREILGLGNSP